MIGDCCQDIDRIHGRETADGLPVWDLHLHMGLLKGYVEGSTKPSFWYLSGRFSPLAKMSRDIRMDGW